MKSQNVGMRKNTMLIIANLTMQQKRNGQEILGKNKMIIKHNGNIHKIARMTGNKNNFLEIILSNIHENIKIKPLTIKVKGENVINIFPEEVSFYVTQGVDLIYEKYKRKFFISEISFCQSDSQPSSIYAFLTFHLLEDIIKNESPSFLYPE